MINDDRRLPALDVRDLVVYYERRRGFLAAKSKFDHTAAAVNGISFSVWPGDLLALVGQSGSGKTTTAHAILGLVRPTAGQVLLAGRDITVLHGRALRPFRRHLQMIYQDPYDSLNPRFRIRRTIEEPLAIHRLGPKSARRQAVLDAMERVGLAPPTRYLDRFPHELSGGQRQRVAIAAALVLRPQVLIADEPVSMLDVSVRHSILHLLADLRKDGLAVLMITHDLASAAYFATHIAVMKSGKLLEQGPMRSVMENPRNEYTHRLLNAVPSRDPRKGRRWRDERSGATCC